MRAIKHLAKKQPAKIKDRHMYVRHLNAGHKVKRSQVGSGSSKLNRWNASTWIIRKHGAAWIAMGNKMRSRFNDIASDYKDEVASNILNTMSSSIANKEIRTITS